MALAPGTKLDIYEIQSLLGAGGMGEVYRATDTKLGRDVALKLLAHGALDKVSPGHLLREAQIASSLSHPNICTIHHVGGAGNDFYVVVPRHN
jgi:serine/threonine protein kinase